MNRSFPVSRHYLANSRNIERSCPVGRDCWRYAVGDMPASRVNLIPKIFLIKPRPSLPEAV